MITKWDTRFMQLAETVATWSKDPARGVGAVLVRTNRTILSVGFNGFPRHVDDTDERLNDPATKLAMTVHAEVNALLHAEGSAFNCTAYVTQPPCAQCAAALIQAGVDRVVGPPLRAESKWREGWLLGRTMFAEAGVKITEVV